MSEFARGAKVKKVKITAADFARDPISPRTLNLMECLFCAFQVVEQTAPTMPRDKFLEITGKAWDAYQKVKGSSNDGKVNE